MAKFNTGTTVVTQGISALLDEGKRPQINECFAKHIEGDWGIMSDEDKVQNDASMEYLNQGYADRVMSAYMVDDTKIWIITEGDKKNRVTTFLLPEEY